MSKQKTVDIFEVLKNADNFDLAYFRNLTEEEKKSLPPYTLMLWMSGCKSSVQLQKINMFMNRYVFDISTSEHRNLMYYLACISSDGKKKRYNWIKKKGQGKKCPTTIKILKQYYNCSTTVASEYLPLVDYGFVEEIANELGEQDDVIKKVKKELK